MSADDYLKLVNSGDVIKTIGQRRGERFMVDTEITGAEWTGLSIMMDDKKMWRSVWQRRRRYTSRTLRNHLHTSCRRYLASCAASASSDHFINGTSSITTSSDSSAGTKVHKKLCKK